MPDFRRHFVEGGTYFFTLKTAANAPLFASDGPARLLGSVMRSARDQWAFEIVAAVLLPDHLHAIWALPAGDANYPRRWAWIKCEFTHQHLGLQGHEQQVTPAKAKARRRGVWQRRYWEPQIRDESELQAYADYIHYNPVKHGYSASPREWPYSSFHRWVREGSYSPDWGRSEISSDIKTHDSGE